MKDTTQNTFDFPPSLAMLIGVAAGLAAGIFIAGKNGAKLRAEIGRAAEDLRQQGSELADRGIRKIRDVKSATADSVRQNLSGVIDEGERQAHGAIDTTVSAVQSSAEKSHRTVAVVADSLRSGPLG